MYNICGKKKVLFIYFVCDLDLIDYLEGKETMAMRSSSLPSLTSFTGYCHVHRPPVLLSLRVTCFGAD